MPDLATRIAALRSTMPPVAAKAALAEALDRCDVKEFEPLAHALLDHETEAGFATVVRAMARHGGSPALRARLADRSCAFAAALDRLARDAAPAVRLAALDLIAAVCPPGCAGGLMVNIGAKPEDGRPHRPQPGNGLPARNHATAISNDGASDDRLAISRIAGEALVRMATLLIARQPGTERWTDADHDALERSLVESLDTYDAHRDDRVLLAAALLARRPGPALERWFAESGADHPARFALRGLLKRLGDESIAPRLLDWLGHDPLAPQALRHLQRLAPTRALAAILGDEAAPALLRLPRQRRRLRRLPPHRPAAPPLGSAHRLNDAAQTRLPEWLLAAPMSERERFARLAEGLQFRTPAARLAALRALASLESEAAEALIASFCEDANEAIARLALRHLLQRRGRLSPRGRAALVRALESRHASLRRLAREFLDLDLGIASHTRGGASPSFERAWRDWLDALAAEAAHEEAAPTDASDRPRLSRARARQAARLVLHADEAAFIQRLRTLPTAARDSTQRLHAIALADELNLLDRFELELLACARSTDARLAATAIRALGALDGPTAEQALRAALRHPDPRARANAVEALERRWKRSLSPGTLAANLPPLEQLAGLDPSGSSGMQAGCDSHERDCGCRGLGVTPTKPRFDAPGTGKPPPSARARPTPGLENVPANRVAGVEATPGAQPPAASSAACAAPASSATVADSTAIAAGRSSRPSDGRDARPTGVVECVSNRAQPAGLAGDPLSRTRANAIKALAVVDRHAAAACLDAMLRDPRPDHRLSALWAAERLAMTACAQAVARLTRGDDEPLVAARAARAAKRLLAAMTASAGPMERLSGPFDWPGARPTRKPFVATALAAMPIVSAHRGYASSHGLEARATPAATAPAFTLAASTLPRTWSLANDALVGGVGALVIAALAAALLQYRRRDEAAHGPACRRFAAALGLPSRLDAWLLHRLARRQGLRNAAPLMLSRGAWSAAIVDVRAEPAPSGVADSFWRHPHRRIVRRRLALLEARLFESR